MVSVLHTWSSSARIIRFKKFIKYFKDIARPITKVMLYRGWNIKFANRMVVAVIPYFNRDYR